MPEDNRVMLHSMEDLLASFDPKASIILVTGSLLEQDKLQFICQAVDIFMSSEMATNPSQENKCILVDIPSFDAVSNEGGLEEALQKIANFLVQLHMSGIPVKAIVHLHDITAKKTSSLIQTDLDMLQAIAGEHFYPRIIFATTFWSEDIATRGIEERRETELTGSLWKPFLAKGAQALRIVTDHQSLLPNLVEICDGPGEVVQITKELVYLGVSLRDTAAGVALSNRLSNTRV